VLDMPREFPAGLVRAHQPDTGQRDVSPVGGGQPERAGGEPARQGLPFAPLLLRGNRTVGPRRLPDVESCQLPSAVARFASPDEYASFEFSAHHGAVVFLARFQVFRRP
jgi:hypothetical protein